MWEAFSSSTFSCGQRVWVALNNLAGQWGFPSSRCFSKFAPRTSTQRSGRGRISEGNSWLGRGTMWWSFLILSIWLLTCLRVKSRRRRPLAKIILDHLRGLFHPFIHKNNGSNNGINMDELSTKWTNWCGILSINRSWSMVWILVAWS